MKEKTKVNKMYILNGSFLYDTGMMQLGVDLGKAYG